MAKIKGNALLVYVNDVAIGCLTNNEFTSTNEEIEAICKDNDGAYDSLSGGNTAAISFEALHTDDATYGLEQILTVHKNKTEVAIRMSVSSGGGQYIQAARAVINEFTWTGPLNAPATYSGTINIRGGWTLGKHT